MLGPVTLAGKEVFEQHFGATRLHATHHLGAVVAGRLVKEPWAVLDPTALGVIGRKDHAADAGVGERGGAHGTGLKRYIEIAIRQSWLADLSRRLA